MTVHVVENDIRKVIRPVKMSDEVLAWYLSAARCK